MQIGKDTSDKYKSENTNCKLHIGKTSRNIQAGNYKSKNTSRKIQFGKRKSETTDQKSETRKLKSKTTNPKIQFGN